MNPSILVCPRLLQRGFAGLTALLLGTAGLGVQAATAPASAVDEGSAAERCLGEQVCPISTGAFSPEAQDVAQQVLEQVYALPEEQKRYFLEQRRDAAAFAIFPNVQRQGFMVATLYGRGILSFRDASGGWSPPILLTMQGNSMGPLFGGQASNIIFTFKTVKGLRDFLSAHHHITVSGTGVAIEHVGHPADPLDIKIHSFDRGVMLGQSQDRYSLHIDEATNAALYGLTLTPCCLAEGTRIGPKAPWMMKYFQNLQLEPGEAHRTLDLK